MNWGQDVLKLKRLFITNDGDVVSQLAGQKGSGDSDDVAEATRQFIQFKGDRFRIKTGLDDDIGSRPHMSRFYIKCLMVSVAM